jgi:hypothetical protein
VSLTVLYSKNPDSQNGPYYVKAVACLNSAAGDMKTKKSIPQNFNFHTFTEDTSRKVIFWVCPSFESLMLGNADCYGFVCDRRLESPRQMGPILKGVARSGLSATFGTINGSLSPGQTTGFLSCVVRPIMVLLRSYAKKSLLTWSCVNFFPPLTVFILLPRSE